MDNYNYTLSIITNDDIRREEYESIDDAMRKYNILHDKMRHVFGVVVGIQLWEYRQGKTIDTDPLARIIKQHYI